MSGMNIAAELPELLPGADEDVLRDLVRFVRPQHPARKIVNPADVGVVEPLEGGGVPAGREGHV